MAQTGQPRTMFTTPFFAPSAHLSGMDATYLYTLCLYHHSQFHLLDFDVVGERKEAAQG